MGVIHTNASKATTRTLSSLQRRIIAWLCDQNAIGTGTPASYSDLRKAMEPVKHSNLSVSARNGADKGLLDLTTSPGGHLKAISTTLRGVLWLSFAPSDDQTLATLAAIHSARNDGLIVRNGDTISFGGTFINEWFEAHKDEQDVYAAMQDG